MVIKNIISYGTFGIVLVITVFTKRQVVNKYDPNAL